LVDNDHVIFLEDKLIYRLVD